MNQLRTTDGRIVDESTRRSVAINDLHRTYAGPGNPIVGCDFERIDTGLLLSAAGEARLNNLYAAVGVFGTVLGGLGTVASAVVTDIASHPTLLGAAFTAVSGVLYLKTVHDENALARALNQAGSPLQERVPASAHRALTV